MTDVMHLYIYICNVNVSTCQYMNIHIYIYRIYTYIYIDILYVYNVLLHYIHICTCRPRFVYVLCFVPGYAVARDRALVDAQWRRRSQADAIKAIVA